MIAIGGVIGAGLFVGSGQAIKMTGPAVLVTYVVTGMLVVLVMRMLGEMSTADPQTGSFSVKSYGEFEFWFAAIKVAAIVVFLLLGTAVIVGLFPGTPSPGLSNLTANGGFAPHGLGPVVAASFVVVFSFDAEPVSVRGWTN